MRHSEIHVHVVQLFQIHTNQATSEIISLVIYPLYMKLVNSCFHTLPLFKVCSGKFHIPLVICTCVYARKILLMTCKTTSLFSILHLAANHGREQLVSQVLQHIEQLQPADKSLLDSRNYYERVSDFKLMTECKIIRFK